MRTPQARLAADSGPVATHNALRYRPAARPEPGPAIAVIAVPITAGTIRQASQGTAPVSGYSPNVTAARQAMRQPTRTAGIRRFTG